MTGLITLLRPTAELTWLRLRLQVGGRTAAERLAGAHMLRAALPELPVGAIPLHARMAQLGALLSVSADGHGVAVYLTVAPDRLAAATELIRAAIGAPLPAELVRAAADEVTQNWQWVRADSESLADLLADLALHTAPTRWPVLYQELAAAMTTVGPPPARPEPVNAILVSAHAPSPVVEQTIAGLLAGEPTATPPRPDPENAPPATLRLPVASESSALLRLAWRTPPRTHPDFPALAVAARILGGHHRSRLMRAFREEQGWSYSPWAMLRSAREHGLWQVSVRVPAGRVQEATARIADLVTGWAPSPTERVSAIAHTVAEQRTLWSSGESRLTLSGYWQDLGLSPESERQEWPRRLDEVSANRLDDVVRRHLSRPPDLTVVLKQEEPVDA
ncbi:M16 family metallopeptidase [Micromonospora chersina]|uniref:M16 family metallopeptidase n=1 Tax=Micromonospora chersina TaxID=47854 RepID=UPI003D8B50D5